MKKAISIKRKNMRYFALIFCAFAIFFSALCSIFFLYNYADIQAINHDILNQKQEELNANLYNTQQYVINMYANNTDFCTLVRQPPTKTYEIYLRSSSVRSAFQNKTSSSNESFGYFLKKNIKNGFYSAYPTKYTREMVNDADRLVKDYLESAHLNGKWCLSESKDGDTFLIVSYQRSDTVIGAILNLSWYGRTYSGEAARILFTWNDAPLITADTIPADKTTVYYSLSSAEPWDVQFCSPDEIPGAFGILVQMPQSRLLSLIRIIAVLLLVFLVVLLLILKVTHRLYQSAIIYPIQRISEMETEMLSGDPSFSIESDIKEFQQINQEIHSLVNQVKDLEQKNHEKEMAYERSQLQYYQLQTEPHFFLNCLKNIYALAEKQQFEKIQYLITVISKHFRYIFLGNIPEIALEKELEEVQSYFDLCRFSSNSPLLLEIRREPNLDKMKVPPLLIQTFVENSIKYGKLESRILSIHVNVSVESGDVVKITVYDDGIGYPDSIIEAASQNSFQQNGHIGIKNAIDRITLLYGPDSKIRLSNRDCGGAFTEILLPYRPEP